MIYYLMGKTKKQAATGLKGTLQQCREYGKHLESYAIYKGFYNGRRFHNTTDERFLVEHKNSAYWINRENNKKIQKTET